MEIKKSNGKINICSECGAEVSIDDLICPFCKADLTEILETFGEVELVKSYQSDFEAQTAKAQLDEAGIKCFLSSDNEGGMIPALSLSIGIKLMVNKDDVDKAKEILKAMNMF
ncbi:MAG: DUF2007 domain-containing protein [Ignavibacteria bacterium]